MIERPVRPANVAIVVVIDMQQPLMVTLTRTQHKTWKMEWHIEVLIFLATCDTSSHQAHVVFVSSVAIASLNGTACMRIAEKNFDLTLACIQKVPVQLVMTIKSKCVDAMARTIPTERGSNSTQENVS